MTMSIEKTRQVIEVELTKKILDFIYARLISVHEENPNYDYMINFKKVSSNALTILNNVERLTVDEIASIMNDIEGLEYLKNSEDKIDRVRADVMKNNHKCVAQALFTEMRKE